MQSKLLKKMIMVYSNGVINTTFLIVRKTALLLFICLISGSCKKYLNAKSNPSLTIPSKLEDLQALLDNYTIMNVQQAPNLLEPLSDDYFIPSSILSAYGDDDQLTYAWNNLSTGSNCGASWKSPYENPIYYSNIVLDQLTNLTTKLNSISDLNAVKGSALFYRAFAFYELAQLYCLPYSSNASKDPGIVLRLTSNINQRSTRSTVEQTYLQIINDFKEAIQLLPVSVPFPTRPNKAAAFGALARAYLSMRDYVHAGRYADSCLSLHNVLMDYNMLDASLDPVFPRFNPEVIFYNSPQVSGLVINIFGVNVDSSLYHTYSDDDLRKSLLFKMNADSTVSFYGSYDGSSLGFNTFDGITSDEMYLTRSECSARSGDVSHAMNDLNTLLIKRWKNNQFVPLVAATASEALDTILLERRKELLFRGLRWTDLRRLNQEGANITLQRTINNVNYYLPPNDPRWVVLIPQDVINLTGISQNSRK
jgi:hypothetical protein